MARSLLFGTSVSPGIAIGVLRFAHNVQTVEMRRISPREVEGEQEQLRAAVTNVRAALQEAMAKVPEDLSEYREVIAAQIELARDPKLVGSALSRIEKELVCAAWALDSTVEQLCSIFRNMDDPYLRDRAQDIRAVGLRLRECLAGSCALPAAAGAGILAAQDLSPADVMDMDFKDVRAVITAEGGPTSHTAILSRGLHIPALVGVTGLLETGKPGEKVIVDGLNGCLLLDPDADDLATYEERQREYQEWEARTRSESHWPAEMRDGVRVSVHANLERLNCRPAAPKAWACTVRNSPSCGSICPARKSSMPNTAPWPARPRPRMWSSVPWTPVRTRCSAPRKPSRNPTRPWACAASASACGTRRSSAASCAPSCAPGWKAISPCCCP